jgi:type IV pilus assembly protein PilP
VKLLRNKMSSMTLGLIHWLILVLAVPAHGQDPSVAAGATPVPESVDMTGISEELFLQGLMDPFEYDPRGRKDPFAQPLVDRPVEQGSNHGPLLPLQRFALEQLQLVGIIWDVKRPRAMIQDPQRKIHIVGPNTKVGTKNGYIAVIREGEIVVVETIPQDGKLVSSAQILRLVR